MLFQYWQTLGNIKDKYWLEMCSASYILGGAHKGGLGTLHISVDLYTFQCQTPLCPHTGTADLSKPGSRVGWSMAANTE